METCDRNFFQFYPKNAISLKKSLNSLNPQIFPQNRLNFPI